jgi:hypothetical protein
MKTDVQYRVGPRRGPAARTAQARPCGMPPVSTGVVTTPIKLWVARLPAGTQRPRCGASGGESMRERRRLRRTTLTRRGLSDEAGRQRGVEAMADDGVHRWRVGSGGHRCQRGDPVARQSNEGGEAHVKAAAKCPETELTEKGGKRAATAPISGGRQWLRQ